MTPNALLLIIKYLRHPSFLLRSAIAYLTPNTWNAFQLRFKRQEDTLLSGFFFLILGFLLLTFVCFRFLDHLKVLYYHGCTRDWMLCAGYRVEPMTQTVKQNRWKLRETAESQVCSASSYIAPKAIVFLLGVANKALSPLLTSAATQWQKQK